MTEFDMSVRGNLAKVTTALSAFQMELHYLQSILACDGKLTMADANELKELGNRLSAYSALFVSAVAQEEAEAKAKAKATNDKREES